MEYNAEKGKQENAPSYTYISTVQFQVVYFNSHFPWIDPSETGLGLGK